MIRSTHKAGSRGAALLAVGVLSFGGVTLPYDMASAAEPAPDPIASIVDPRYGNVLCKLFPDLRICKKK